MPTAADLPVATIVAYPGVDGVFVKESDTKGPDLPGRWASSTPRGMSTAYDDDVDYAITSGATVLRRGA